MLKTRPVWIRTQTIWLWIHIFESLSPGLSADLWNTWRVLLQTNCWSVTNRPQRHCPREEWMSEKTSEVQWVTWQHPPPPHPPYLHLQAEEPFPKKEPTQEPASPRRVSGASSQQPGENQWDHCSRRRTETDRRGRFLTNTCVDASCPLVSAPSCCQWRKWTHPLRCCQSRSQTTFRMFHSRRGGGNRGGGAAKRSGRTNTPRHCVWCPASPPTVSWPQAVGSIVCVFLIWKRLKRCPPPPVLVTAADWTSPRSQRHPVSRSQSDPWEVPAATWLQDKIIPLMISHLHYTLINNYLHIY